MADVTINDLIETTSVASTDLFHLYTAAGDRKLKAENLYSFAVDIDALSQLVTPSALDAFMISDGGVNKYITFSDLNSALTPVAVGVDFTSITVTTTIATSDYFLLDRGGTNYRILFSEARNQLLEYDHLTPITTAPDTSYVLIQASDYTLNQITIANLRTSLVSGFTNYTDIFTVGDFYSTGGGDLGTTTNRFTDLYLDGSRYFYHSGGSFRTWRTGSGIIYHRDYQNDYTIHNLWSVGDVTVDDTEATLSLSRSDVNEINAEVLDLYSNGYNSSGSLQMGLRVMKKGTGTFRPFVFDKYDQGTTALTEIMRIDTTNNAVLIGTSTFGITSGNGLQVHNASGLAVLRLSGNAGALDIAFDASNSIAILDTASAGDSLEFRTQGVARLALNDSGSITLGSTAILQSSDYASGVSGWRIDGNGDTAEFNNIVARGVLSTTVFKKDQISATAGNFVFANASVLTVAINNTQTKIYVKENVFSTNDRLRIKPDAFSNELMKVTGSGSDSGGDYINVTRGIGGTTAAAFDEGVAIVSMEDRVQVVTEGTYPPYIDVVTRTGDGDTDETTKARLGNLDGIGGGVSGWGLWSDRVFLTGTITATAGAIGGWSISGNNLVDSSGNLVLNGSAGAITAGTGTSLVGMQQGKGFWAGAADYDTATTFKVSPAGAVTMTSATIGTINVGATSIYATGNGFILNSSGSATFENVTIKGTSSLANFTVGNSTITSTNFSMTSGADPTITLGSGTSTVGMLSSKGFWAGASAYGAGTYGTAPLTIALDGKITASSVDLTGKITATSGTFTGVNISAGTIAGFTFTGTSITATNFVLDSSVPHLYLGTSTSNRVGLSSSGIWAGAADYASATTFKVSPTGALTATSANVTGIITTGALTATAGTIAGFSFNDSTITATNLVFTSGATPSLVLGTGTSVVGMSTSGFWAGDSTYGGSPEFKVSTTGVLTATGATISGAITATSGTIGNWTLDSGNLKASYTWFVEDGVNSYLRLGNTATVGSYVKIDYDSITFGTATYGAVISLGTTAVADGYALDTGTISRFNIAGETTTPVASHSSDTVETTTTSDGVVTRIETRSIYVTSNSYSYSTDTGTHSFSGYCQHATIHLTNTEQYGTAATGEPKCRAYITSISYNSGTNITSVDWYVAAWYSKTQAVLQMFGRDRQ